MSNFDTAREALETSLTSSGSAMAEHAKWSESLEARLNKLKATWQSLSQSFMNSDFLKVGLNLITDFVDILDKLISKLGSFGTIGLGVGLTGIFKNFGTLKTLAKDVFTALTTDSMASIESFNKWSKASDGVVSGGKKIASSMSAIAGGIGIAVAAIGLIYNHIKKLKEEQAELRRETIESSNAFLDSANKFEQTYIKYADRTDLTMEEEAELESAINGTIEALGDKSSALQDVVNSSNDYIAALEQIAREELKAAHRKAQAKLDASEDELKEAAVGWSGFDGSEVDIEFGTSSGDLALTNEAVKIAKEIGKAYYHDDLDGVRLEQREFSLSLSPNADVDEIVDYYNVLLEYRDALSESGLEDTSAFDNTTKAIGLMEDAVNTYIGALYDASRLEYEYSQNNGIPKTVEEYLKMRESILSGEDVNKQSLEARKAIANSLDSDYKQVFDLSSAEVQARKLIGILDNYGENEAGEMETFLNMRTAVNNNECTVGEYLSELNSIASVSENFSEKEKEEFNLAFGLDTDTIKEQYEHVYSYIKRNYLDNLVDASNFPNSINAYEYAVEIEGTRIRELLDSLSAAELSALVSIKGEIDWETTSNDDILKQIKEETKLQEALSFEANIEVDTTALEALNEILAESASAMGLSEESIDSLKSKYKDLDGYNPATLFEATANGVKVNRDELVKLEKEYNNLTKAEVEKHLETLAGEYNDVTAEIDKCTNAGERAELLAKREMYADQIEELATYQAQLEGVTGAYQRWIDAQNTPEDYEGYQAVATSREDIKDEISRGFLSNATKEYIDLLSGEDLVGGTIDDYAEAWTKLDEKVGSTSYSIHDFFTVNDDGDITATGIDRFFDGIKKDFEGEVYKFNEDTQEWYYDFSAENLKTIQDEWGIGIEAIELLLEAAASAGYDVDWDGILDNIDLDTSSFESLVSVAENAQKELNKLEGYEDLDFNFSTTNIEDATSELEKAQRTYNELVTGEDGKININAEGAGNARVILSTLLVQKQQLEDSEIAINISTSGLDDAQAKAVAWVQDFRTKYKNLEIAISTGEGIEEAKTELETVKTSLGELDGDTAEIAAQLVLGEDTDVDGYGFKAQVISAIESVGKQDINVGFKLDETAISNLNSQLLTNFTVDATAKITEVDKSQLETVETSGMVTWTENVDGVSKSFEADGTVNWNDDVKNVKTSFSANGTVTWTSGNNVKVKVVSKANGTANADGTAQSGRAFTRGDWGIKGSGTALVGELGMETLVRDGHFYTIGDNGAEFVNYKHGDIIFNHKQTEELFKNGRVTSDGGRGRMYANGSAFADGSYPSIGRAFWGASATASKFALLHDGDVEKPKIKVETEVKNNFTTPLDKDKNDWSATATETEFSNQREDDLSSTSDTKEFKETFDWIEVAIDRIERSISRLDQKANNIYETWTSRNNALKDEIGKVGEEIDLQQSAYDRYIKAANGVGLSESYAEKVRNGTIDIDTITDETLAEKIKEYQEW